MPALHARSPFPFRRQKQRTQRPVQIVALCAVSDRPSDNLVNGMHAGSSRWLSRVTWVNGSPSDLGDLLRAGVEASRSTAFYDYTLLRDDNVVQNGVLTVARRTAALHLDPSGDRFGTFVAARLQATGALIVEPGLRFDHDSATRDDHVSPRLAAALPLGARTTLRASWGHYYQSQGLHELAVPDGETRLNRAELAERARRRLQPLERLRDRHLPARHRRDQRRPALRPRSRAWHAAEHRQRHRRALRARPATHRRAGRLRRRPRGLGL